MQKRSSIKSIKISDFLKCNYSYAVLEVEKEVPVLTQPPPPPPPFLFNSLFSYLFILNK